MNTLQQCILLVLLCTTWISAEVQERFQWEEMNKNSFGLKANGKTMDYGPDGLLYIGGNKYISTWDGEYIRTIDSVDGYIYHLEFSPSGELHIAGDFDSVGVDGKRIAAQGIAKKVNEDWIPLGAMDGSIVDFDFDAKGTLYAGGNGSFYNGIAKVTSDIAKWDGENWSSLGISSRDKVMAVHCGTDGKLYIGGGSFNDKHIENTEEDVHIAMFDGEKWYAMDGTTIDNFVLEITEDAQGTIYTGGNFGGSLAKWNGEQWEFLMEGREGIADIFIDTDGSIYVDNYVFEGNHYIQKYENGVWVKIITLDREFGASAFIKDPNSNIIVTGAFESATVVTTGVKKKAHHIFSIVNGEIKPFWNAIDKAVHKIVKSSEGNIVIGGEFTNAGIQEVNHLAQWDGETWQPLGKGVNGTVYDIQNSSTGTLTVAGEFTASGETPMSSIATWNGQAWSAVGGGLWNGDEAGIVRSIVYDAQGNLYAAGYFTHAGMTGSLIPTKNIAKWNGTNWSALSEGVDSTIYYIAIGTDGTLYAGGEFTTAGAVEANHIASWNGTTWTTMGEGVDSLVRTIALDNSGVVHIGGDFDLTINNSSHKIVKWDGVQWQKVSSSVMDTAADNIYEIKFDEEGRLWASSEIRSHRSSILILNEGIWTSHDYIGGWIHSIVFDNSYVYIGGSFTDQYNNDNYITRASIPQIIPVLPDFSIQTKGTHFDPHKAISLYNVRGQLIGLFENGLQLQQSLRNNSLSSGLYFQRQGSLVQKLQIK